MLEWNYATAAGEVKSSETYLSLAPVTNHYTRDRSPTATAEIMADVSTCPALSRASVQIAHQRIVTFVHRTPVATCETINLLASTPQSKRCPKSGRNTASEPAPHETTTTEDPDAYRAQPRVKLFFKCENQQRIGAFKARGAFHALGRLIEEEGIENVREKGVCTHSSGTLDPSLLIIHADG